MKNVYTLVVEVIREIITTILKQLKQPPGG